MVTTVHGLPLAWALTGAKADERQVLEHLIDTTPALRRTRERSCDPGGQRPIVIGDKNYFGKAFDPGIAAAGIELLRPARKNEKPRPGKQFFAPLRQVIESVFDTFKGQLDLERHGGKTPSGVCARVAQRVLALTAAIWHNDKHGLTHRSLTAYDH